MDNKNLQTILIAAFGFVLLNKLAGGIGRITGGIGEVFSNPAGDERKAQEAETQRAAGQWGNVAAYPSLWRAKPLTEGLLAHDFTVAEMDQRRRWASLVDACVAAYHDAKGIFWDDEGKAVAAIAAMPDYITLLLMAETFFRKYGETLGTYGDRFLEPEHKAAILAVINNLK